MTNPTVTVSFGRLEGWVLGESLLGTDTTLADFTYEDITAPVMDFNIRRGRQHELDRIEAGVATLTLLNQDGAFTPTNTASPYYPDIRPMAPIKITAEFEVVVPPFDPLTISGMVAWYAFDEIGTLWQDVARTSAITADGQIIKGVTDKSGTAHHLSEATNGPEYKVGIQAGKSVARFDGTNDKLTGTMTADASTTVFIVAQKRSAPGGASKTLFGPAGFAQIFTNSGTHASSYLYFANQAGATVTAGGTATNWTIVVLRSTSTSSMDLYFSGGTASSFDPNDAFSTAASYIYGGASASNFGDYDLGEILIYNSALSSADLNNVGGGYLADRWSVTWTDV